MGITGFIFKKHITQQHVTTHLYVTGLVDGNMGYSVYARTISGPLHIEHSSSTKVAEWMNLVASCCTQIPGKNYKNIAIPRHPPRICQRRNKIM